METFAPILGMSMIVIVLALFLVSVGGMVYIFWRRSVALGENRALEKARQEGIRMGRQAVLVELMQALEADADNRREIIARED